MVPGDSAGSYLVELVAGTDPGFVMPQKGARLTGREVGLVRAWIDRNLPWEEGIDFRRRPSPNLEPARPPLPESPGGWIASHPVDAFVSGYFRDQGFEPPPPVSDRLFARRAWLDAVGLLPPPGELEAFLEDPRFDKRRRLVERLLADRRGYADHWLSFWNDLLRNDYRGTGFIDGGRRQISAWLHRALAENRPYDRFVHDLVSGSPGAEGFTKGIVWRGVVNASQQPAMQAAQNVSQVFLGVNLKCASCHDSFVDDWTLEDAYGMAGFFSEGPLAMHQCDRPLGRSAPLKYLHSREASASPPASRSERMEQLAGMLARRENGRLSRTIVNRLWSRLMGQGLVPDREGMEAPARIPGLLDWLAEDLADHGFDLKHTLALLMASRTYQLPSVPVPDPAEEDGAAFRGPLLRRLSAEQFVDALGSLAGSRFRSPASSGIDLSRTLPEEARRELERGLARAEWIALEEPGGEPAWFERRFELEEAPASADIWAAATGALEIRLNDRRIGEAEAGSEVRHWSLKPHLGPGEHILRIAVLPGDPPVRPAIHALVRLSGQPQQRGPARYLGSGLHWEGSSRISLLQDPPMDPREEAMRRIAAMQEQGRIRSSMVAADPLTRALGRPSREQVVVRRPSEATTLQALELTNGETLAEWLSRIAPALERRYAGRPRELVESLYAAGLGRPPLPREASLCMGFLEDRADGTGVEDLLWALAMQPEFQLIR